MKCFAHPRSGPLARLVTIGGCGRKAAYPPSDGRDPVAQPPDAKRPTGLGDWYHTHIGAPFHRHLPAIGTALTLGGLAIAVLVSGWRPGGGEQPTAIPSNVVVTPGSSSFDAPIASPTRVATKTEVIPFRPYTDRDKLAAQFKVGRKVAGLCDQPSRTTSSSDAMRCFGDDGVYDPCWSNLTMDQVACLEAPWDAEVVILEPVNIEWDFLSQEPSQDIFPFAIELETRQGRRWRCDAIVAFAGEIAGLRRNYGCSPVDPEPNAPDEGSAFGELDKSQPLWRVRFGVADAAELEEVIVLKAWT